MQLAPIVEPSQDPKRLDDAERKQVRLMKRDKRMTTGMPQHDNLRSLLHPLTGTPVVNRAGEPVVFQFIFRGRSERCHPPKHAGVLSCVVAVAEPCSSSLRHPRLHRVGPLRVQVPDHGDVLRASPPVFFQALCSIRVTIVAGCGLVVLFGNESDWLWSFFFGLFFCGLAGLTVCPRK